MIHPIMLCTRCKARKPPLTPERDEELFLYCSQECRDLHESESLARRLEAMKTHDPATRRVKSEGELRAMGVVLRLSSVKEGIDSGNSTQELARPKRVERKKNVRKCGKCGNAGHNARTCKVRKKD